MVTWRSRVRRDSSRQKSGGQAAFARNDINAVILSGAKDPG